MLDPSEKEIIDDTIIEMTCSLQDLITAFYSDLFEAAPKVRVLFKEDTVEQANKLHATLQSALRSLDNPELVAGDLYQLGARHVGYGVKPADYTLVNDVLIGALSSRVRGWGPDHDAAWQNC